MPEEAFWETLFDLALIISRLRIDSFQNVAEFGCGYGTFSIPVAKAISGKLYTFDIESAMVARTVERSAGLQVVASQRDVMQRGFGVCVDAVLLFNILHCEQPVRLLQHARSALLDGGKVLAIHWRNDIPTPRGPAAEIRPCPEEIITWAKEVGLTTAEVIDLPPWHYGIVLEIKTS